MFKIAIYCDHLSKPVDFSKLEEGNPGIGGTEYCFSLLLTTLAKSFSHTLKLTFFSTEEFHKSDFFECCQVTSFSQLFDIMENDNFDFLILRTMDSCLFYEELKQRKPKVKIIFWSHNYFNAHIAAKISKESCIVANVFVSKQMYDFYYDHDIINKSTYIFNPVVDNQVNIKRCYEPHTAVYMGSIVEEKGILHLLKLWQIVLKKYPDAVLKIIGKGTIYSSRNIKPGKFGIASEDLEKKMIPFLCAEDGTLKKNYELLGILGKEKYDVFRKCAVGIVNPSAKTETFGLGIIEMATVGLPVVTRCWNGHLDTVKNGETGLMALSLSGMAKCIIRLFEDEKLNAKLGFNAKEQVKVYDPQLIAKRWYDLICLLAANEQINHLRLSYPWWNNYKILRYLNSKLRFKLGLNFLPTIVSLETMGNDFLKKLKH